MKDSVSHQLVKYLEDRSVRHIFGLCGHTNIAFLSALEKSSISFINVFHEQIAAHAADGYARVTGKAAVVLTHLGPGLTNAATGVANAAMDCIPLVIIAGDIPSHYYGKHPHQEVNLHARLTVRNLSSLRETRLAGGSSGALPGNHRKSLSVGGSGQPGPVLVDVPMDIFSEEVDKRFSTGSGKTPKHSSSRR